MTKEQTINCAIDCLMDEGFFNPQHNYTPGVHTDLSEMYDRLHEEGYVSIDNLASHYIQYTRNKAKKAKTNKRPRK